MNDQQANSNETAPDPSTAPAEQTDPQTAGIDHVTPTADTGPRPVGPQTDPDPRGEGIGDHNREQGQAPPMPGPNQQRHGSPIESLRVLQPASMTRGTKARLAVHLFDELKRITYEDPAFDLARQYINEAQQVLPSKAD